jgi:hypothetical protein
MRGKFCQTPKILRDRRKGKLELCSTWPAQAEAAKAQDALQMRKQHLNLLSVSPCSRVSLARGGGAGDIAGFFIDAARDFPWALFQVRLAVFIHRVPV